MAKEIGLELEGVNDHNRMTADIKTKMAGIKSLMISNDMGEGMKGCKKLLSQQAAAEADLVWFWLMELFKQIEVKKNINMKG